MNITECDYLQFKDQCLIGEGKLPNKRTYHYQFFATWETFGYDTLDITLIFLKKFGYPFPEIANTNPYKENKIGYFLENNRIWSRFLKH